MTTPGQGGFVHMDTGGVASVMTALSESGRALGTAWQGSSAAITANEAGIGSDVLGQAFRASYATESTALRDTADRVPTAMLADAEAGAGCVADYRAADARGAAAFPR